MCCGDSAVASESDVQSRAKSGVEDTPRQRYANFGGKLDLNNANEGRYVFTLLSTWGARNQDRACEYSPRTVRE